MDKIEGIVKILKSDVNLNLAPDHAIEDLARYAERRYFQKGEYVFRAGEDSDYYYAVEKGRIILSKEAPSGKIFTYVIAVPGMTLNAVTCFKPQVRFFSARVAENSTVIAVPCEKFRKCVLKYPEVTAGILNYLGGMIDAAYTRILDIIDESAETRVLNALAMLCSRIGEDLPLTNSDVAEMTGVSRETAARVISRLQEAGLISKMRGTIKVLDKARLEELSTSPFFIL
jgi:CRP-like cAMP-binding protein